MLTKPLTRFASILSSSDTELAKHDTLQQQDSYHQSAEFDQGFNSRVALAKCVHSSRHHCASERDNQINRALIPLQVDKKSYRNSCFHLFEG